MSVLEVKELTHTIKNKLLYSDASFTLNKEDHMGITGLNGTGKSTLINIIIGRLEHDKGQILWQKNVTYGYLDQHAHVEQNITIFSFLKLSFKHLYEVEKELNNLYEKLADNFSDEISERINELQNKLTYSGFYDIESQIHKVAVGLGIDKFGMNTLLSNISGGQRAKVILAKLLLESPDVLIMDEPTNFLDKEHVDWLTTYLQGFIGAFIIISHDFDFLNKITNCILDIEFQKVTKYTGNFQQFLATKEERKKNYITEFEKQQEKMAHLQEYYDRWHAGTKAKSAQSRLKQLEKIKENELEPPKNLPPPNFILKSLPIGFGSILRVNNLVIGYNKPLLPALTFHVNAGDKLVISGFNGIGKTTLVKTLLKQIPAISGTFEWSEDTKIGYFDQDLIWPDPNKNAYDVVKDYFPHADEMLIRKHLAMCAIKGKLMTQPVGQLSGGEQVKIKICILTLTKCNLLILDEPTNHIDVDTKKVLAEQLKAWTGSIILITHEHSFYSDWTNNILKINGGGK